MGRESAAPGTLARLFHTLVGLVITARWKRDWPQYWMLRGFCNRHWPADLPRPAALTERVWPKLVYPLKDAIDWAARKWDQFRRLSSAVLEPRQPYSALAAQEKSAVATRACLPGSFGYAASVIRFISDPARCRPRCVIYQVFEPSGEYKGDAQVGTRDVQLILDCGANIGCSCVLFPPSLSERSSNCR